MKTETFERAKAIEAKMNKLLDMKNRIASHNLVITSNGVTNTHMWDSIKDVIDRSVYEERTRLLFISMLSCEIEDLKIQFDLL